MQSTERVWAQSRKLTMVNDGGRVHLGSFCPSVLTVAFPMGTRNVLLTENADLQLKVMLNWFLVQWLCYEKLSWGFEPAV